MTLRKNSWQIGYLLTHEIMLIKLLKIKNQILF